MEAVELLRRVHGSGDLPATFVALLLCSCRRWDRVTARPIAAIDASGLLCGSELDELAESLLSHELVISYPLTWVSPQWLGVDLGDGASRTCSVVARASHARAGVAIASGAKEEEAPSGTRSRRSSIRAFAATVATRSLMPSQASVWPVRAQTLAPRARHERAPPAALAGSTPGARRS